MIILLLSEPRHSLSTIMSTRTGSLEGLRPQEQSNYEGLQIEGYIL